MSKELLLSQINEPSDLRNLTIAQLPCLANELREFILHKVSATGGHLASNLGSIELTIALHYVYNTPRDLLIWDVGHQTYSHKILTGRKDQMHSLRQLGGLAGFPQREESIYDCFGVGHSSTSISAALGMAIATNINQEHKKVVAIIGDGAMTAGLAFEGLNNAGWLKQDILVILNDNEMSISENVGAISSYLSEILASRFYNTVKGTANRALSLVPSMQKLAHKVEEHVKGMIMPSTMFEELGFNYLGPIDGHDTEILVHTLNNIKKLSGPQFLHVVTKKGQGYKLAETDPIAYHAVSKFKPDDGMKQVFSPNTIPTYTQIFGTWLCEQAEIDKNFVAITPAMREGSGMVDFALKYPQRFFDVGIAEQHAITFAAGIATQGIKAIVAIYSTFLQRGYDQLIHDVALQKLPVLFAIDRGGVVGADGPTHVGAFDLSFLRIIPNLIVMTPSNESECYQMLCAGLVLNQPCAIRYPRGCAIGVTLDKQQILTIGQGKLILQGKKIAFLAFGAMVNLALEVAETIAATVYDMRFVKPLDQQIIIEACNSHQYIVTIEENVIMGGAGSACLECMTQLGFNNLVLNLGLPDQFIEHGDPKLLLSKYGLDQTGVIQALKNKNFL